MNVRGASFTVLVVFFSLLSTAFGESSQLKNRGKRRIDALNNQIRTEDATWASLIATNDNEISQLNRQLNRSNTRSESESTESLLNRINALNANRSKLSNDRSNRMFSLRQKLNDLTFNETWKTVSKGQSTTYSGERIPDYAEKWRKIDDQVEFFPRGSRETLELHAKRWEREFDVYRDGLIAAANAETSRLKKEWDLGWMADLEQQLRVWEAEQAELLNAEPEAIIRERALRVHKPFADRVRNTILKLREQVDLVLNNRENRLVRDVIRPVVAEALRDGYTLPQAKIEMGYILNEWTTKENPFFDRFNDQWSGPDQNGGLKAEWNLYKSKGGIRFLLVEENKKFSPYGALKKKLMAENKRRIEYLTETHLSWFPKEEGSYPQWLATSEELLRKEVIENPHIAKIARVAFDAEREQRGSFLARISSEFQRWSEEEEIFFPELLREIDAGYDHGRPVHQLMESSERKYEERSRHWAKRFEEWFQSWSRPETGELARLSRFIPVAEIIATQRARYPLRYQPEGCRYLYEVQLKNEINVFIYVDAKGAETELVQVIGRRSFSCSGEKAVLLADAFQPRTIEINQREPLATGLGLVFDGGKLQQTVETPDPALTLARTHFLDKLGFVFKLKDPDGNWLDGKDDFALNWNLKTKMVETIEVPFAGESHREPWE